MVKNLPAHIGDTRDAGSIPGSGRSPGGGRGNPFWYSCLENPMDRGAWQATVYSIAKSQTQLKRLSTHIVMFLALAHMHVCVCVCLCTCGKEAQLSEVLRGCVY